MSLKENPINLLAAPPPGTAEPRPYIAPGRFIAIDESIYEPQKRVLFTNNSYGSMGTKERLGITYGWSGFVSNGGGLNNGKLKVNYGSYIYNQITGYASNEIK